jgi:hypothetical protein
MESMSASPFFRLKQDKYLLIEVYTYVDYQAIQHLLLVSQLYQNQ